MQYQISNRPSEIDFECGRDGTKRILQNIHNLLMTQMGEVPFDRMRGLPPQIYEMPMGELEGIILPLLDAMLAYEPRATATDVEVTTGADGRLYILCTVEIEDEE